MNDESGAQPGGVISGVGEFFPDDGQAAAGLLHGHRRRGIRPVGGGVPCPRFEDADREGLPGVVPGGQAGRRFGENDNMFSVGVGGRPAGGEWKCQARADDERHQLRTGQSRRRNIR